MRYLAVALGVLAGALMSAVAVGLTYRLLGPAEPLGRVIGRSMLSAAAIVTFALAGYTVWQGDGHHSGPPSASPSPPCWPCSTGPTSCSCASMPT